MYVEADAGANSFSGCASQPRAVQAHREHSVDEAMNAAWTPRGPPIRKDVDSAAQAKATERRDSWPLGAHASKFAWWKDARPNPYIARSGQQTARIAERMRA